MPDVAAACDWTQAATWTFEPLDDEAFPSVQLARRCLDSSERHTAALNAANEQAVHAFLDRRLPYLGIFDVVRGVLDDMDERLSKAGGALFESVDDMLDCERQARRLADARIAAIAGNA